MKIGNCVAFVIVGVLAATGCGDGVTVDNKNPTGTVGGLVVDGESNMPIANVAVSVLSAGGTFTGTTGADGFYRIGSVPAGAFTVQLSVMGYVPISFQGTLSGSDGNFPISNPIATLDPIGMVAVGANFVVRVVDQNGAPVAGVKATLRTTFSYVDFRGGSPAFDGGVSLTATTAADGRLVFSGMPDIQSYGDLIGSYTYDPMIGDVSGSVVIVSVAPIAVMGQDNYEYAGGVFMYNLLSLGTSLPQIQLSGPTSTFGILESNIEWLVENFSAPSPSAPVNGSIVPTEGPITMAFSEAIDPATVRAQVTTESGAPGPALTPTVDLNTLSLVPATPFTAGARYNLVLHADPALNASAASRHVDAVVPFFAQAAPGSEPTVATAKLTGTSILITLSEPIGLGNGENQSFSCVVFYEGINLDGSAAGQPNVAGEWSSDPSMLSCSLATPVTSPPLNGEGVDSSAVSSAENYGSQIAAPVTGFSTVFTTSFEQYTYTPAAMPPMPAPGSSAPAVGTKGHLYFGKQNGTVHRVTGEPVTDITFTVN